MIVRTQRYTIESIRCVNGKVVTKRFGYVISVKRHWWKVWEKPRYIQLLPGWQHSIINDENVRVRLVSMNYATTFTEGGSMDFSCKSTAELIVSLLKEQPNRFILA